MPQSIYRAAFTSFTKLPYFEHLLTDYGGFVILR